MNSTLTTTQQTIKMMYSEPGVKSWREITPDDYTPDMDAHLVPMFLGASNWYTIPDYPISDAMTDWLAQWGI